MGMRLLQRGPENGVTAQRHESVTNLSGVLGAKQLVVVRTQSMFSSPSVFTRSSKAWRSVLTSSPSKMFSITTGSTPGRKE